MSLLYVLEALAGKTPDDYTPVWEQWGKPTLDPWAGMVRPGTFTADLEADRRATEWVTRNPDTGSAGVVKWAESQLGTPYVWAASSPDQAFDCSGFTMWILNKAGLKVPHLAEGQQNLLPSVGRNQLQVGDLVFFNYGRKAAGVADHVGLYVGNGQMIDASSSEGEIVKRGVDWDHFIGGGATGISNAPGGKELMPSEKEPQVDETEAQQILIPEWLEPGSTSTMGHALGSMLAPQEYPKEAPQFQGSQGDIKAQLWKGFMDAGRPDLAKMVSTKDFQRWIAAESGWKVDSVSQAYTIGDVTGVNGGLFQIRFPAHPWAQQYFSAGNSPNGSFTASAYLQAKLIAQHFPQLSPARIREYSQQILNHDYHGWP